MKVHHAFALAAAFGALGGLIVLSAIVPSVPFGIGAGSVLAILVLIVGTLLGEGSI